MQGGGDENRQEGEDHLDERGEPGEEKEIIQGKEGEGEMEASRERSKTPSSFDNAEHWEIFPTVCKSEEKDDDEMSQKIDQAEEHVSEIEGLGQSGSGGDVDGEDFSPRLATQLSLHEELRMSSSFADHSDNEPEPEVSVDHVQVEEEGEGKEDEEGRDEEEGSDPIGLFLPHKPFCGRLTNSALSKAEEYSETETYSSGFSEDYKMDKMDKMLAEDYKMGSSFKPVHRHTQTCDKELSDIPRPVNHLDNHFQTTPRYKVIFKEIFQVLKQANNKVEIGQRHNSRSRHQAVWQPCSSNHPIQTSKYPQEPLQQEPSKEGSRDIFKPKMAFTDYSSLPPATISSMESMARLKQIQESYASVLRRGIHDAQ